MTIQEDSSGQSYTEVPLQNGEHVRVTYIRESWAGVGGVRVQIRQVDGHLRQGPELPVDVVGSVVSAVIDLIRER